MLSILTTCGQVMYNIMLEIMWYSAGSLLEVYTCPSPVVRFCVGYCNYTIHVLHLWSGFILRSATLRLGGSYTFTCAIITCGQIYMSFLVHWDGQVFYITIRFCKFSRSVYQNTCTLLSVTSAPTGSSLMLPTIFYTSLIRSLWLLTFKCANLKP